jgi:hypothetical protein
MFFKFRISNTYIISTHINKHCINQRMISRLKIFIIFYMLAFEAIKAENQPKKKKNIVDMTDAEINKIYEQWEVRLF